MRLKTLPSPLSICSYRQMPQLPTSSGFYSLTVTPEEISLVVETDYIPEGAATCEHGWRALMVQGPLDFALVGILAELSSILAKADISIFAISSFDTDFILVKEAMLPKAVAALKASGHVLSEASATAFA